MRIFCGLGNPGAKYAANRHNIGFMALDHIAQDHSFSPWRARFQGLVSEGLLAGEKVVLLKPQTFMNLSGQSVGEALRFYKLQPEDLIVFHDELDLPPGKLRLKQGGGMRATTVCALFTDISARHMAGCAWALAIPAIRMPWRRLFCMILPRQMPNGWIRCWPRFRNRRRIWPKAMVGGFRRRWLC